MKRPGVFIRSPLDQKYIIIALKRFSKLCACSHKHNQCLQRQKVLPETGVIRGHKMPVQVLQSQLRSLTRATYKCPSNTEPTYKHFNVILKLFKIPFQFFILPRCM